MKLNLIINIKFSYALMQRYMYLELFLLVTPLCYSPLAITLRTLLHIFPIIISMPAAIYRKKFRMLSDGTAPGHILPPPVSLFNIFSLPLVRFKFQLIDKKKTPMLALLLQEFVTGQYLSVHSDEFGTSDLFSPRSLSFPAHRFVFHEAKHWLNQFERD